MIPYINLKPYVELVRSPSPAKDSAFEQDVALLVDKNEFLGDPASPVIQKLEFELRTRLGVNHAIACANGTDALQLALRACGVERGHRVAIPNMTFWATYEAVVNIGATPVLLDISETDSQLNFTLFEYAHAKRRFDAAILVHLYGWCSTRLDAFRTFCRDRRITLIEDGAQAFGVTFDSKSVFADADVATMSFHPAKVLGGIGDGGAVITKNPRIAARVRTLANHGRVAHHVHEMVGWNSRMDAIQAVWLLRALDVIDKVIERRREIVKAFGGRSDGHVVGNGYMDARAFSDSGDRVVTLLRGRGVDARRIYSMTLADQPGAHEAVAGSDLGVSRERARRVVNLPVWYGMTDEEVEQVKKAVGR